MTSLIVGVALISLVVGGFLWLYILCYGWKTTVAVFGAIAIIMAAMFAGLELIDHGMSQVGNTLGNTFDKIDKNNVA